MQRRDRTPDSTEWLEILAAGGFVIDTPLKLVNMAKMRSKWSLRKIFYPLCFNFKHNFKYNLHGSNWKRESLGLISMA